MNLSFSVNEYDRDGFCNIGIYLHFGETKIRIADNLKGFQSFVGAMQKFCDEISEKYVEDLKPPEEFIAFSNSGGRPGQYDRFDYSNMK